jgi:hypothetical protein
MEGSLLLMMTTLTHSKVSLTLGSAVEGSSSRVENELKEEKVYTHLDKKERDAETWVLDTGGTNHMSGCWAAFTKLNTVVLDTVCFGDDLVARIKGHMTVVFVCKNNESR